MLVWLRGCTEALAPSSSYALALDSLLHGKRADERIHEQTQAIDDVHRSTQGVTNEEKQTEGKAIVAELARLKHELQHNRELEPLPQTGDDDIARYNQELEALDRPKWHDAPWLFAECYLFRCAASAWPKRKGQKAMQADTSPQAA